jgi:type I restriction enzyme S subunit
MPSIANINGTDLSKYKIVKQGQFAFGPVTSRNGDKISIALMEEDEAIVSTSYVTFEIINHEELLPEYLMLWFKRPEFDRYARFMSHGSVREIFDWDKMCNVTLPIPSHHIQKNITETISKINRYIYVLKESERVLLDILDNHYNKIIKNSDYDALKHSDHISLVRGVEPGSDNYLSEECDKCIEFYRVGEILNYSSDIYIKKNIAKNKICRKSDILVSFDGTIGKVAYGREGAYSSGLRKIEIGSKEGYSSALLLAYFRSQETQETLLKYATGTTILHASSAIPNLKIKYDSNFFHLFNQLGEPVFKKLLNIIEKINKLENFEKIIVKKLTTL